MFVSGGTGGFDGCTLAASYSGLLLDVVASLYHDNLLFDASLSPPIRARTRTTSTTTAISTTTARTTETATVAKATVAALKEQR